MIVTTSPAVSPIPIVKMPEFKTVTVFEPIRHYTWFLHWTPLRINPQHIARRAHWPLDSFRPSGGTCISIGKMSKFLTTADSEPIRNFSWFLHGMPRRKVANTMSERITIHLTVTAPPAAPLISIGKMPDFQTAADYQAIRIFTRFLHGTPWKNVGNTLPRRTMNHLTVTALPAVPPNSIGKMSEFLTAAESYFLTISARKASEKSAT